jgi:ABC-type Na+ transport system ATPase subunit NatA
LADIIVTIHNGQIVSVSERAEVEARQVLAEMTYSAEERVP